MIYKEPFGVSQNGESIDLYSIVNSNGLRADVMTLGCTLTSLVLPTKDGTLDVCLGYNSPKEYEDRRTSMGAVCGRYANRIKNGTFSLNDTVYHLECNNGKNHLHGGTNGYAYRVWNAEIIDHGSVRFYRTSPSGEEGYPGTIALSVIYTLDEQNTLSIRYEALSDADTILNLTNHAYWNLNGHSSGCALDHSLQIPATFYCACDSDALVTGEICSVIGTPFDFRFPRALRSGIEMEAENVQLRNGNGYDHCYLLDGNAPIVLTGNASGISMEITTDMPAVHLYTANHLKSQPGKRGAQYQPHNSICLETEQVPDAPNNPQFPSAVLRANEPFVSTTKHSFHLERVCHESAAKRLSAPAVQAK